MAVTRPLSPAERAMRIAWKVQLSEDTRQRKLAMRADSKDRVVKADAKRARRAEKRNDAEWTRLFKSPRFCEVAERARKKLLREAIK